ncbi:MAG: polysaccharide deacetylase family protein [Anaeromicrobium sp.]|uniref:polysaccharide deacetylase family protein n=1 Tax=Anaeromicrobium sp. TaxID=1929132 RepID=UPI0025E696DE|nr:polysaccharide deacetylase family protein [Anaeromicrobium sp.]MCT4594282.1 polysaccharide deacetylase family protein [Anaeromicrobium sp.]
MYKKIFYSLMFIIIMISLIQINNIMLNKVFIETFFDVENSREIILNGPKDKKVVALTFDDGPHPRYTPKILDLLEKYHAKATFFVIGKHVKLYPEVVKRQVLSGHEVGNHTFSHINIRTNSSNKIWKEFQDTQDIIYKVTGKKATLFRPPFGFYNNMIKNMASQAGCSVVLWSTHQDSKDWSSPGVDKIVNTVLNKTKNGDIILLHDYVEGKCHTIEALEIILPELKKKGFEFLTVSELLNLQEE